MPVNRPFRHIAIIDPAVLTPELDVFNHLSHLAPLPLAYHLPALFGMGSLTNTSPSALVILGSSASVNDNAPWQIDLNPWVKEKILTGVPAIGFCYGHQMLAHLFGAQVGFLNKDQSKTQGFREISFEPNALWSNQSIRGELFVSHREEVKTCPEGFVIIGKSPQVSIDALAHTKLSIWSFQSHPEATPLFLKNVKYQKTESIDRFQFGYGLVSAFFEWVKNHIK